MSISLPKSANHHFRFHAPHAHLAAVFGEGWFANKAEAFARLFGTPKFLLGQTAVVLVWVGLNTMRVTEFDLYPFILLNLAFSLQSAYAAPLILLAQTRQADRDKAYADADAQHREELAQTGIALQHRAAEHNEQLRQLLEQNTRLTEATAELSRRIADLTEQIHGRMVTS